MQRDGSARQVRQTGARRRGFRWLTGGTVAAIAILGLLIGEPTPGGANPTTVVGGPGTMTSSTVNANLTGTFDKIKDAATGSFTTDYPTWVASTDNDQLNGTITPSATVDSHLAGLSVSSCVLHITSFALKVTGAVGSPLHPNLASQIAPLSSALPLAFSIPPSINIGPLSAPSTGAGNIVVALIKISGTTDCYTSGGTAVVTNGAVVYARTIRQLRRPRSELHRFLGASVEQLRIMQRRHPTTSRMPPCRCARSTCSATPPTLRPTARTA